MRILIIVYFKVIYNVHNVHCGLFRLSSHQSRPEARSLQPNCAVVYWIGPLTVDERLAGSIPVNA